MNNRPSAPLFATINVTNHCNLSCNYCFYQPRSDKHMPWESYKKVIDELSDLSLFFINISGGEPFLHPRINEFIEYAHRKFRHVMVLSNGTVLDESHIKTIRSIVSSKGSFVIQVSLDSADPTINSETRGRTEDILENIRILDGLGADIVIAMVITRFNVEDVTDSILGLTEYTRNFHLMTVQDVRTLKRVEERYSIPEEAQIQFWNMIREVGIDNDLMIDTPLDYQGYQGCANGAPCMAAFSQVVIDPTLEVRPCDRLIDVKIGNLKQSTLIDIWNSEEVIPLLTSMVPYCRLE